MPPILQKYTGRIIAIVAMLAVTVYTVQGIARLSQVMNGSGVDAEVSVQTADAGASLPLHEEALAQVLTGQGSWQFADSFWSVMPGKMTTAELENLILQWPATIPGMMSNISATDVSAEEQNMLEMIQTMTREFYALANIQNMLNKAPLPKQWRDWLPQVSWQVTEQEPFCRYTMIQGSFCADFLTLKQDSQKRFLQGVMAYQLEENSWGVMKLQSREMTRPTNIGDRLPMPEQCRMICARWNERNLPLVEIHETELQPHELIPFWKKTGWIVDTPANRDTTRIRCSNKTRIVEVLVFPTPDEGTRLILVHLTNANIP